MAFQSAFVRRVFPLGISIFIGMALLLASHASAEYTFVTKWGSTGTGDSQFREPRGIAVDSTGNVYVTDPGDGSNEGDEVKRYTSSGGFLNRWGSQGMGDVRLFNPWGLAVDSEGFVYVADTTNNYVKKFSATGSFVLKMGGPGTGDGQFSGPPGVAVDSDDNVYATDFDGAATVNRVQKFKTSIGSYLYDDQWGITGSGPGEFNKPHDLAVDSASNVYVSDWGNHRIQKFDSEGFFITQWGGMGSDDGQLAFPEGIATDSAGNVYVVDRGNNRIQKFTSNGTFVTKWGSHGTNDGQFREPMDVAVDANDNVYVVDTTNDRIQKFSESGGQPGGGGSGGAPDKGGPILDVTSKFKIENAIALERNGKIKFKLNLPAPGEVEATAKVKAPPRPPSLDPDQRQHEGHKSAATKAAKKGVTIARGNVTAAAAGPLTLILPPNKKGKKYLGWESPLKATVTIAYRPAGGTASSITRSVKFKLTRKPADK